jgi:preprotein translocase subunit SecY
LRTKIVFTLLVLAACRIGTFIPVPGINGAVTIEMFKRIVDFLKENQSVDIMKYQSDRIKVIRG